ncbi:MAG: hypothetical protein DHS20C17_34810 [Cyclobacteriaceae bacterium]|nr:MAG: hypothetical protein DHS20C17_34810 [Cyclobacteriaceae bacterium]
MAQSNLVAQQPSTQFEWPEGKQLALSLTFDDARQSQVLVGTPFFDSLDVKATFYVVPESMKPQLDGWKAAVEQGHEIGNHTVHHPCTGNFVWSQDHPLEDYTLSQMRNELATCNQQIKDMLGVTAVSYAYTCGQKFIGRGSNTKSYIPLIAELFTSGRGFLDETANAPGYLDLAQLTGIESDGKEFDEIKTVMDQAREDGAWVVLAGHEIGDAGRQTTTISMLEQLIDYAQDPANGVWLATVAEITEYVLQQQASDPRNSLKEALTFHASYDHGFDADYNQGSGHIYTAEEYGNLQTAKKGMHSQHVINVAEGGRFGGAIEYKSKSKPVLYYKSEDNIAYNRDRFSGTISLWLQLDPEKDLEPGYCDPIQITDVGYNDAALWVDFSDKNPRSFRMGVFGDLEVWNPQNIGPDKNVDFTRRLVNAEYRPFGRDQWTHVVISYNNLGVEGSQVDFYVNGQHQGARNIPETFTWDVEKSKIFIGLNYVGLIDDLAIFNKGFSEEEVGVLYSLTKGVGELY